MSTLGIPIIGPIISAIAGSGTLSADQQTAITQLTTLLGGATTGAQTPDTLVAQLTSYMNDYNKVLTAARAMVTAHDAGVKVAS